MDSTQPPQKKGIGVLGWLGIGCGGLIVLAIIAGVLFTVFLGPKFKQIAEDAKKDPTRTTAMSMVNFSMGQIEMVAQDEANKRYTVRQKGNGKLTTIYWDAKKQAPAVIEGDFSAIPKDAGNPGEAVPK